MDKPPAPQLFQSIRRVEHRGPAPSAPPRREPDKIERLQAQMSLRRLRYFVDLVEEGYSRALNPNPLSRCLRAERIALGIDLPELDTVPLWASLHKGRIVCIPFIEYLLAQIRSCLAGFCENQRCAAGGELQDLESSSQTLSRFLRSFSLGAEDVPALPRLKDTYLEKSLLEQLCGEGGLLRQILSQCESLMDTEVEQLLEKGVPEA